MVKSADDPGRVWLDNLTINGVTDPFNTDPGWDQLNNRNTYVSTNVRPRFDFGYSPATNHAGGQGGEIGGHTFRGDSRLEFNGTRMAYYGDPLNETLTLDQPLHAEGKIAFHRGVSDSTTLIGFFHSADSVRSNNSQNSATPENFVGAAIEGPSAEGFYLYPTYGLDQEGVRADGGRGTPTPPFIYPNGDSHRLDARLRSRRQRRTREHHRVARRAGGDAQLSMRVTNRSAATSIASASSPRTSTAAARPFTSTI